MDQGWPPLGLSYLQRYNTLRMMPVLTLLVSCTQIPITVLILHIQKHAVAQDFYENRGYDHFFLRCSMCQKQEYVTSLCILFRFGFVHVD